MNPILKTITYLPALRFYLKGVVDFNTGNFENAKMNLEKCIKHPSFNNELALSHYGQTLCALGQLEGGHGYLLKACEYYEAAGWQLREPHELQVAQRTLSALRHIAENTAIEVADELLHKNLNGSPTM